MAVLVISIFALSIFVFDTYKEYGTTVPFISKIILIKRHCTLYKYNNTYKEAL